MSKKHGANRRNAPSAVKRIVLRKRKSKRKAKVEAEVNKGNRLEVNADLFFEWI